MKAAPMPVKHLVAFLATKRTATHITGALLFVVGILSPALLLTLRGASSLWLAQAWTMATIAAVGIAAMALPENQATWTSRAWAVLAWSIAAVVLANLAFAWVDLDAWVFRAPSYLPAMQPIGNDFRLGGYGAAQAFSTENSGWPPLTVILFLPYLCMTAGTGYVVHTLVLVLANITTIAVATVLAMGPRDSTALRESDSPRSAVARLAPLIAVWLFASYGFVSSIDRGSIDALAGLFAVIGLASLMRRPHDVWAPAILFALAANTKVYPAVLLLLLIWRFRWRSLLPIVLSNAILALIAGPENLVHYMHNMTGAIAVGGEWVGNSSAKSFSAWIDYVNPWYLPHVPSVVLLAIPAVVFLFTAARLWRRRDAEATMLMACSLFPLMFFVPTVSHDYKTVLLTTPLMFMIGYLFRSTNASTLERWWILLLLAVALFFCARAPGNLPSWTPTQMFIWPALLMNKYLPVLLLQMITAWMAWRLPAPDGTPCACIGAESPQLPQTGAAA